VKVCPHCAEELPDEATVCPECHKDPAVAPAWATTGRADDVPPWWSEDRLRSADDPSIPNTVPARYRGLEPLVAQWFGIPRKVRASLFIGVAWGYAVGLLVDAFLLLASPYLAGPLFGILLPGGYAVGLILGHLGRAEIEESDRVGQILAWGGIGLNGIRLLFFILSLVPAIVIRLH
jgi:hypothetical protein